MYETKRVVWRPEVRGHAILALLEVYGANFSFLRVPDHLGTGKNDFEQRIFFREKRVFLLQIGPKSPQNGPKWGPLGVLGG